jgi:DNA primase
MSVAMIELEAGEDPDSYLKKRGKEAFRERLERARPALAVFMESALQEHGEGPENRARAIEVILGKLQLLKSSVERRLYLQELAEKTGLDVSFLQSGGKGNASDKKALSPPVQKSASLLSKPRSGETLELKSQNWLLILLATDAEIRRRVTEGGTEKFFADEERRKLADRLLELDGPVENVGEVVLTLGLTETQKQIATEIFRLDLRALAESAEQIFRDCCMAADRQQLRKRTKELTRLIMEAEKAGDNSNLAAYSAEKMELNRRLQNLR